jgi:hypothetical protein
MEYTTMGDSSTTVTFESSLMTDDLFTRELDYQAGLSIVEGLLLRGLLTEGDYQRTKALLLAKYRPPIGELLAETG